MATDAKALGNVVRVGRVSSVDTAAMTARVVFPDKDNMVSAPLHLVNRGSAYVRDYWIPVIDEQVLCLFLPNVGGRGVGEGFILGSFFSKPAPPQSNASSVRRIDFGDGSYIEHDSSSGALTVHATGPVKITGSRIDLN